MAPIQVAALHGLGVPQDRLERLASASGLSVWQARGGAGGTRSRPSRPADPAGRVVVVVDSASPEELRAGLDKPFTALVESVGLTEGDLVATLVHAAGYDLYVSLTTVTANRLELANRIATAIAHRHPMAEARREDMELALHEATTNAVIHGNLGMDSMKGLSITALDRFSRDLTARLTDPAFAKRRLEVSVGIDQGGATVEVADQGSGFSAKPSGSGGASGRGLELIAAIAQSYEILDGGRRIRMRFAL